MKEINWKFGLLAFALGVALFSVSIGVVYFFIFGWSFPKVFGQDIYKFNEKHSK